MANAKRDSNRNTTQGGAVDLAGQYAMVMLIKIDTNTWELEGNLV